MNLGSNDSIPADSTASSTLLIVCPLDSAEQPAQHRFTTDSIGSLRELRALKPAGELGTPRPYSVHTDNALTIVLLLCFALFVVSIAQSGGHIVRQMKGLFRSQKDQTAEVEPISSRFYIFMGLVNCLLLAIASYIFATEHLAQHFIVAQHSLVVAIFFLLFLAYYGLKALTCSFVNGVFFGSKKSLQWTHVLLLITALEAFLFSPLVLLLVFFNLSTEKALFCFGFILFLNKLLTFYKCWSIFFRQSHRSLQIFLYFCALEAAPLLALAGIWLTLVNLLKVNF